MGEVGVGAGIENYQYGVVGFIMSERISISWPVQLSKKSFMMSFKGWFEGEKRMKENGAGGILIKRKNFRSETRDIDLCLLGVV